MATKIRLMRLGKIRAPHYRIVVADSRTKREGRVIETIGKYHPKEDPSFIEVDADRAGYWLGVGAQPTEPVVAILKVTGDWQRFKGLPAPPPMLTRAPRPDKRAIFEAATKESLGEPTGAATTPRKRAAAKKAEPDAAVASGPAVLESEVSNPTPSDTTNAPDSAPAEQPAPDAQGEAPSATAVETPAAAEPAPEVLDTVAADEPVAADDAVAADEPVTTDETAEA